jgi:hypothetical protein
VAKVCPESAIKSTRSSQVSESSGAVRANCAELPFGAASVNEPNCSISTLQSILPALQGSTSILQNSLHNSSRHAS